MVDTLGWITQVELIFRIGVFGIHCSLSGEPGLERASCAAPFELFAVSRTRMLPAFPDSCVERLVSSPERKDPPTAPSFRFRCSLM